MSQRLSGLLHGDSVISLSECTVLPIQITQPTGANQIQYLVLYSVAQTAFPQQRVLALDYKRI